MEASLSDFRRHNFANVLPETQILRTTAVGRFRALEIWDRRSRVHDNLGHSDRYEDELLDFFERYVFTSNMCACLLFKDMYVLLGKKA